MSVSSYTVANEFIALAKNEGESLTNMQLQKLVFIAQGYTLAILERQLYYHNTHAWQWGPVVPKLYKSLQKYGSNIVTERLPSEDSWPVKARKWKLLKLSGRVTVIFLVDDFLRSPINQILLGISRGKIINSESSQKI